VFYGSVIVIKKKYLIAGAACTVFATVLMAAQVSNFDIRQNIRAIERVAPGYGAKYIPVGEWVDDPAELSGDVMIPCLRVEDEEGRAQWVYESSNIMC
jgi:hypothetical protein